MTKIRKAAAKGLAALGVAGLAVAGAAGAAFAAPAPGQDGAPDQGSLTIHKYLGSAGTAGDGSVLDPTPSGDLLDGVEFTIYQLGQMAGDPEVCTAVDLSIEAGWNAVPTATAPNDLAGVTAAGFCVVNTTAPVTGEGDNPTGQIVLDKLPLGLYYVVESDASGANVDGEAVKVVTHSAPFYVTIPFPNKDAEGGFIYDVNVYPKNQDLDAPGKEITDPQDPNEGLGYVVGDVVEWTITQTIPPLENVTDAYTEALIYDVLPSSLSYDSTVEVTLNGTALTPGPAGYMLDKDVVSWALGSGVLAELKAGDVFVVKFRTVVEEVTPTGEIENPGGDLEGPGYGFKYNGKEVPGNPTPYTYWGQLVVKKVDEDQKPLAGAEFEVTEKGAEDCAVELGSQAVYSTGTSGADGVVLWTPNNSSPLGLFVANSNDGPLDAPTKDYCVYETKVPAGYTGAGVQKVTIKSGATNALEIDIENTQNEGPDLPLTGANGTTLMVVGGVALVAIAGGLYLATRRKAIQE